MSEAMIVLISAVALLVAVILIGLIMDREYLYAIFVSILVVIGVAVIFIFLDTFDKKTYYSAVCNETIYNVYEANDNYYLAETDAKIILPNCVLIENQND